MKNLLVVFTCFLTIAYCGDSKIYPESPTNSLFLSQPTDGSYRYYLIDYSNNDTLYQYSDIVNIIFSPQGRFVLSLDGWETYKLVDESGTLIGSYDASQFDWWEEEPLFVSDNGGDIICVRENGMVEVFDIETQTLSSLNIHEQDYSDAFIVPRLSPNGYHLYLAIFTDEGKEVSVTGASIIKIDPSTCTEVWRQNFSDILGVEYVSMYLSKFYLSYSGKFLIVGGYKNPKKPYNKNSQGYVSVLLDEYGSIKAEYKEMRLGSQVDLNEEVGEIYIEGGYDPYGGNLVIDAMSGNVISQNKNPRSPLEKEYIE